MKARGCILVQHPATEMYYTRSKGAGSGTLVFDEHAEETGTAASDTEILAPPRQTPDPHPERPELRRSRKPSLQR